MFSKLQIIFLWAESSTSFFGTERHLSEPDTPLGFIKIHAHKREWIRQLLGNLSHPFEKLWWVSSFVGAIGILKLARELLPLHVIECSSVTRKTIVVHLYKSGFTMKTEELVVPWHFACTAIKKLLAHNNSL